MSPTGRSMRGVIARSWRSALAVLLLACLGTHASPPSSRYLLTNIPEPHPAVAIDHVFPGLSHPRHIVAGEPVSVVFTVRNSHSSPVNVTVASGSVNVLRNFGIHVQNLTVVTYRAPVPSNTEASFEFRFETDPRMPARQFTLALTAFYSDTNDPTAYAQTFFNGTTEVLEPQRLIDTEAVSLWLTLGGLAIAIGYAAWSFIKEMQWFKDLTQSVKPGKLGGAAKTKAKAAPATTAAPDMSDYLAGTAYAKKKPAEGKKAK